MILQRLKRWFWYVLKRRFIIISWDVNKSPHEVPNNRLAASSQISGPARWFQYHPMSRFQKPSHEMIPSREMIKIISWDPFSVVMFHDFFLFLLSLQGLPLTLFLSIGGVAGSDSDVSIEHNDSHNQTLGWPGKCRCKKQNFPKLTRIIFAARAWHLIPSVKTSD